MAVTIQVRRGTKAALNARAPLAAGELGFTTDEKLVYIGDGSANYVVGRVFSGSDDPAGNPVAGTIYFNTTSKRLFYCDGANWVEATAAGISINDEGTGSTDIWSAQKIQSAIDAAMVGIGEFQDSVKDRDLTEPPQSPLAGDRYMVAAEATGGWSGRSGQIAEYADSKWVFTEPTEGMCAYVDDEDLLYIFNGTSWTPINNYALASSEPGAVSGSTSGQVGTSSKVAREDHNHDLGEHDHSDATKGGTISHGSLTDGGTNSHSDIDTFISSKGSASGLASLNASSLVIQDPANATTSPSASKIPLADAQGKIADGWLPTLDGGTFS